MNKGDLLRCLGILTYVVLTIIDRFCFNIADYIYNHCLEPVYEYVEKNEYDKAYVIFQKAFYEMLHTFDIQIENKKTNKKIKRLMNENH